MASQLTRGTALSVEHELTKSGGPRGRTHEERKAPGRRGVRTRATEKNPRILLSRVRKGGVVVVGSNHEEERAGPRAFISIALPGLLEFEAEVQNRDSIRSINLRARKRNLHRNATPEFRQRPVNNARPTALERFRPLLDRRPLRATALDTIRVN